MNIQEQHNLMRYNAALILLKKDRKAQSKANVTEYVRKLGITIIAQAMQCGASFDDLNKELPAKIK